MKENTILATATLRSDFDVCVKLFSDYLRPAQEEANHVKDNCTISGVQSVSKGRRGNCGGRGGRGGVECGGQGNGGFENGPLSHAEIERCTHIQDKYYSKSECGKFIPAEKARLHPILHEIQRPCTGDKRELTSLQARVDQLELQNWASKDDDNSESDGDNLTNSALTDQKSPSKKAKHEK
jgi:hypothetical protein